MDTPRTKYDWPKIRDAYVNSTTRPSYAELSEEFLVPVNTLTRVSSDEGWPDLREKRLALTEQNAGALEVIQKAAGESRVLSSMAFEALCGAVSSVVSTLVDLDKDKEIKPRARSDILNTLCFALQNASNAAKGFGITSLPEALKRAANELPGGLQGNGQWSPQLLNALNITINTMKEGQDGAKPVRTETVPTVEP